MGFIQTQVKDLYDRFGADIYQDHSGDYFSVSVGQKNTSMPIRLVVETNDWKLGAVIDYLSKEDKIENAEAEKQKHEKAAILEALERISKADSLTYAQGFAREALARLKK